LFLLFTYALVAETKGLTLEDIERNLMQGSACAKLASDV
jgi:hypothetical protein